MAQQQFKQLAIIQSKPVCTRDSNSKKTSPPAIYTDYILREKAGHARLCAPSGGTRGNIA
jgi:hypothetical protein